MCTCLTTPDTDVDEFAMFVPTSQPLEDGEDKNLHQRASPTCRVCGEKNGEGSPKIIHRRLIRRASPVKFKAGMASVMAPAARIPSLSLIRRVTSPGPVKRVHYGRAASRMLKEILAMEALTARMRYQYVMLRRKAGPSNGNK
ncbi:hypothetical protein FB451DRAFT_1173306 [Mycena latifolia]|nr:hypothetical protein FB451DRAFT_1173306 [Mycena latifolia]